MTLNDWAAVGSLVSSLGVIISLLYLARQIRQSERQARAGMSFGRTTRIVDINLAIAQPENGDLLAKARAGRDPLTRGEMVRFYALCRAQISNAEDNWLQHSQGLLDDDVFANFRRTFRFFLTSPAVRAIWTFLRPSYEGGFLVFMDELAREGIEFAGRELADAYPDLLAAELAKDASARTA
jgi:hypothetical protein